MRKFLKLFVALFAFAMCAAISAEARSITGVERVASVGAMSLVVTLDAGESGDTHALYVAYDVVDKGDNILNWAAIQRGCVVAADTTSATIPISPLLAEKGYVFCRVFLTTSAAPYDTLIESLRQTVSQYIDTGIKPDSTTIVSLDFQFSDVSTKQQRVFGVSSDTYKKNNKTYDDATAKFSFDAYINGSGFWASACKDGKGDWISSEVSATKDRMMITLDATTGNHTVSNQVSGAEKVTTRDNTTTRTETSAGTMLIFAQRRYTNGSSSINNIAKGGLIYGGSIITNGAPARIYHPCMRGGRPGLYDEVSGQIFYSAVAANFEKGSDPVACSLLAGESQVAVAPAAIGLFFDYTWRGTAPNWGDTDAWTKDSNPATWVAGNNAIFETATTVTLTANAVANSIAFNADTTIATNGTDEAVLAVKSVAVDAGVSATISAPTSGALEKTGAGELTLTQKRTDATIVTEGTLKMDGATLSALTLGTDGGVPVTLDYGGQELQKNPQDFLVTGSIVTLTNGVFSTVSSADLNIRDDNSTMPSVLTIAKDATLKASSGKQVYINKPNGIATINIVGGKLEQSGSEAGYLQHKAATGRLNINVTEGGIMSFPEVVQALTGGVAGPSPKLYMMFSSSSLIVGDSFNFGSNYKESNFIPDTITGVFAATNSVLSLAKNFAVGRNERDEKQDGSLILDFENCTITAKTFAVYYDRPLNNARFNGTRFVFNKASGSIVASDDAANWITVGEDGLILDTQEYSATLNANLGGSGSVTKVGEGTLVVSRNQATDGGIKVGEGTLTVNGGVTFAGPAEFAAGTTLNIAAYNGTASVRASELTLPSEGSVSLTLNGGSFAKGIYEICSASNVTAADGSKFAFATATEDLRGSWSVDDGTLLLMVGEISGNFWTGRGGDGKMSTAANWVNGVPEAGADIDLSLISSATTIIVDPGMTFGAVTMGTGVVTFSGEMVATSFTDTSKVAVGANSSVTIEGDLIFSGSGDQYVVKTVGANGRFVVTGLLGCETGSSVKLFPQQSKGDGFVIAGGTANYSSSNIHTGDKGMSQKWAIGTAGMTGSCGWWCLNEDNMSAFIYPLTNDFKVAVATCLREKFDHYELNTTGLDDGLPHTITLDAGYSDKGKLFIAGTGKVVVNHVSAAYSGYDAYSGAVTVQDSATLAINAGKTLTTTGMITVNGGATLQVAESASSAGMASVTLGGDLSLIDNACLGFNFTKRTAAPVLALASGKNVVFAKESATNIVVKISGSVWPVCREHQLTTCGGFGAEGVSVSLLPDSEKWAKKVEVKDGNIVLTVKPKPSMIIIR